MINYIDNHSDSQKSYKSILSFIIKKGKTTRREIQKVTNYSWSSVSSVVSVLINKKHVIETDAVNNGVGRGTSYIIPNGEKFVSIGVDFNSVGFTSSVIGIDGSLKFEGSRPFLVKTKENVLDLICELFDEAIDFVGDKYTVVSLGLSCQGSVKLDHATFVKFPFCEGLENFNFKTFLEDKYHIHSFIEHDTNSLLETYRYQYQAERASVCVARVVSGIGFSISINGQSVEDFGATDFGHSIVQPIDGALCKCGAKGCLEAYSSSEGLVSRTGVSDFSVIDANRDAYRKYLDEGAFYLGVTFANVAKIFNLSRVVVTGSVIGDDEKMFEKIKEAFYEFSKAKDKDIELTHIKKLSPSYGVARLSLKDKVDGGKLI